jgi:hypothetical protein
MGPVSTTFQFRSDLFEIDPKEDEETNPFCYGKALAEWVRAEFERRGYQPEPIVPEDWGWCVVLKRKPFLLWVACGNDRSEFYERVTPEEKHSFAPDGSEITWSCFAGSDAPIWTAFFWKSLIGLATTDEETTVVTRHLQEILTNEPRIHIDSDDAV